MYNYSRYEISIWIWNIYLYIYSKINVHVCICTTFEYCICTSSFVWILFVLDWYRLLVQENQNIIWGLTVSELSRASGRRESYEERGGGRKDSYKKREESHPFLHTSLEELHPSIKFLMEKNLWFCKIYEGGLEWLNGPTLPGTNLGRFEITKRFSTRKKFM